MQTQDAKTHTRQAALLAVVQQHGFATIETLAQHFGVSEQTVRRDIITLDREGRLRRYHGGAGLPITPQRLAYAEKKVTRTEAKERIAERVSALIKDGESVFLDVGTTAEAIAEVLSRRVPAVQVITSSLNVAALLGAAGSSVIVTGGRLSGADGSLTGPDCLETIARYRADHAVVSCSGFDADGHATDFDREKIAVKLAMLARARTTTLAADAAKFEKSAPVTLAPMSSFDHLVSDAAPPQALAEILISQGVTFELAQAVEEMPGAARKVVGLRG